MTAIATIGLIVPPAAGAVPAIGPRLYPNVNFRAAGLGLDELSRDGYDGVIDAVTTCASSLVEAGVDAVSLMGTSLSFYRGADFNDALTERLAAATGLPTTTMSHAIRRGLGAVGATRVAVATAYSDAVTARLRRFLVTLGFEVAGSAGLGIRAVADVPMTGPGAITSVAERAITTAEKADALLISCGGLDTLDLVAPLEARFGVPVVASSPAGFWDAVQLVGVDPHVEGHGRLLATTPPSARPPVAPVR